MKTANHNANYPLRGKDAYLAEFRETEAKKAAAKATMVEKAKKYRKVIRRSFTFTCLTAIIVMSLVFLHFMAEQPIFTPVTIVAGAIMLTSLITFFVTIIAQKIWEHNLLKIGLTLPLELE